jgi:hypothetical protein
MIISKQRGHWASVVTFFKKTNGTWMKLQFFHDYCNISSEQQGQM